METGRIDWRAACGILLALTVAVPPSGAEPAAASGPGEGTAKLVIQKALPGGKAIEIHVAFEKGACVRAIADAPEYNRAVHPVDASGLKAAEGTIKGVVKVTIKPDHWVPQDGKEAACELDVDATVKDGKIAGTYKGKLGVKEVSGAVAGATAPAGVVNVDSATIDFTMDDALDDAQEWKARISIQIVRRDGKVQKVHASPDKTSDWAGKPDVSKLTVALGGITGELVVTMENTPTPHVYQLQGTIVGQFVGGTFTGKIGKKNVKGMLKGSIRPAK